MTHHPAARDRLAAAARIVDVDGLNVPALLDAVRDADALVVRSETEVTEEVIAAGRNLRVVARAGVGVDNIDLTAATRAGVLVLNAPGANAVSAAEHTIALLLAVTRQMVPADVSTRAGQWPRKKMRPIDLAAGRWASWGWAGSAHKLPAGCGHSKCASSPTIPTSPLNALPSWERLQSTMRRFCKPPTW